MNCASFSVGERREGGGGVWGEGRGEEGKEVREENEKGKGEREGRREEVISGVLVCKRWERTHKWLFLSLTGYRTAWPALGFLTGERE